MPCQREARWDRSVPSFSFSLAPAGRDHLELAPRHEHSSGAIAAASADLSGFTRRTLNMPRAATRYFPTPAPTQFFLQKASRQQALGIKISLVSLRLRDQIGRKRGHVSGLGQFGGLKDGEDQITWIDGAAWH